jgi:hypothetical protein
VRLDDDRGVPKLTPFVLKTCRVFESKFVTYASEPDTARELGLAAVATLAASVGAAGLLMLKTCSVFGKLAT